MNRADGADSQLSAAVRQGLDEIEFDSIEDLGIFIDQEGEKAEAEFEIKKRGG